MNKPDWEAIESAYRAKEMPEVLYAHFKKTGENFLAGTVRIALLSDNAHENYFDNLVPPVIRFEEEFSVPRGRVDFLLIHNDGSATVCELKDGRNGLQSVLAGIGQVICYSLQIGMSNTRLTSIRKALLYSRINTKDDELVYEACLKAGVIPIPIGSENEYREAAIKFINLG